MRYVGLALALLRLALAERFLATVSWGDRRLAEGELQVTIRLSTETWRLRLRKNYGLVASGAHVLHGLEGTTLGPGPAEHCFYLGELEGATGATGATGALAHLTASISTCNGQLSGMLIQGNRTFLLEAEGQDYWLRDLDQSPLQLQHEVLRFATGRVVQGAETPTRRLAAATKYIEVLVVNDFERYTAFGGQAGLAQLATHTVSVLNTVTGIYRAAPTNGAVFPYTVQVVLVAQHTFVTSDPWTATMVGSEVAEDSLLEAFLTWSAAEMAAGKLPENDNRLLLSGRDFVASTVGYAPLSSMCDVSRSGSINMCGASNQAIADCAATVAHEMGHNFGMAHDSGSCPQSGYVMAAVSQGQAAEQFTSCSVADLSRFFQEVYAKNGECLGNKPSRVFGDPVCGNGFREDGEDCDCGSSDCSVIDPCCDGASCKFADASYHCSDAMSPCCSSCRNVTQEAQRGCRAAKSSCDRAELCPGGTAECPRDEYFYPGDTCTLTHNGKSYSGLCAMGSCHSMEYTCAVDVTRDFSGTWDLSDPCAGFNDDCQTVVCHDASSSSATECAQRFSVHGIHMPVPDGTPCWHPSEPNGQRTGMCFQGRCQRPESLAVVALCGNGGIDYGEECDCGNSADPCCDCSTCSLLNSSRCSALDACCDASTCSLKAAGVACRAATSSCDRPERCSGNSPLCPVDEGEPWGTPCMATDGTASTCYGKVCLPSLDEQCKDKTGGQKPVAQRNLTTGVAREFSEHGCTGPWCCSACNQLDGEYSVNGLRVLNPVMCTQCSWSEVSSTFTVNGVSKKIYLGAAVDGTKLADPSKICLRAEAISPSSSCGADEFLELSVGRCLPCDKSCSGCYGATALDCACCRFGVRDGRGMCPMSLDENGEAIACTFRSTTEADPTGSSDPIGSVNQCISGRFPAVLVLLVLYLAPGRLM